MSMRELHQKLGVGRDFTSWAKQMFGYGFTDGQDYYEIYVTKNGDVDNQAFKLTMHERNAKGISTDYVLSLDSAKEIAMLQRSDVGKAIRQYFIDCEKSLHNELANDSRIPKTYPDALRLAATLAETIEKQAKQIEEAEPKLATYEAAMSAEGVFTVNEAAKMLGTGEHRLFKFLRDNKLFYLDGERNVPMQQYITNGWFVVKFKIFKKGNEEVSYPQSFVTPQGVDALRRKMSNPTQNN